MPEVRPDIMSDEPDKGKSPPPPFTPDASEREAEAEVDDELNAEEAPAPPIDGVQQTVQRHPWQGVGPVGPSPLGPEGGRVPTEVGDENIDELTR